MILNLNINMYEKNYMSSDVRENKTAGFQQIKPCEKIYESSIFSFHFSIIFQQYDSSLTMHRSESHY